MGLKDSRGKIVKRPVIIIELIAKDGTILEVPALIDSGADTTTINKQYADALGIKLKEEKKILGVGHGKMPVRLGNLPFTIKNTDLKLDVPAWYIDSENVSILLGQEVFFDTFKIIFEKDINTFEIIKRK